METVKHLLLYCCVFGIAIFLCFGFVNTGFAEEQPVVKKVNVFKISLEELSDIEVFSASRQNQRLDTTSVPMTVVSREDIHYSGATNIYEILQFSPSIDMLRVDRNRYALGIRGMHDVYSDRTLALINGRPAENTYSGGSEFLRQPLLMEDIERIEIVRGPGGAAWGANAFNGVINVITKKPEDCLGLLVSTQWNTFGDNYEQFRWAAQEKQWSWRVSGGWKQQSSTSDILDKTYFSNFPAPIPNSAFETQDFTRGSIFDTEFINHLSSETELSFGVGRSHNDSGAFPMLGFFPDMDGFEETIRSFAKLQTQFDETSSGYIQWSGNFANTKYPSAVKYRSTENDLESQLTFSPVENHTATVGGNLRFTTITMDRMFAEEFVEFIMPHDTLQECSGGVFFIDRWQATDSLALEGQFRQDYSNETGDDWSVRLATIIDLNKDVDEVVRFAFARAYRAPKSFVAFTTQRVPLAPGVYGLTHTGNENIGDVGNEGLQSYEVGYDRELIRGVHFSSNLYKQRYSDLIGYNTIWGVVPGATRIITPTNIAGADAWGAETEIKWHGDKGSLSAWYSLNKFEDDGKIAGINTSQITRSYAPAEHKAGLTGRLFLSDNFILNANYKYTTSTDVSHLDGRVEKFGNISMSNIVDISLSRAFKVSKVSGELLIGVSDILNETERVISSVGLLYYPSETPGRTFFARLQLQF